MNEELKHHGVRGMRWGFRRYQNKDGSLTPAGRKRADKLKSQYLELTGKQPRKTPVKKSTRSADDRKELERHERLKNTKTSELTNKEIQDRLARLSLEKQLRDATPPKQLSRKEQLIESGKNAIVKTLQKKGPELAEKAFDKIAKPYIDQMLGVEVSELDKLKSRSTLLKARKEVLEYERDIRKLKDDKNKKKSDDEISDEEFDRAKREADYYKYVNDANKNWEEYENRRKKKND